MAAELDKMEIADFLLGKAGNLRSGLPELPRTKAAQASTAFLSWEGDSRPTIFLRDGPSPLAGLEEQVEIHGRASGLLIYHSPPQNAPRIIFSFPDELPDSRIDPAAASQNKADRALFEPDGTVSAGLVTAEAVDAAGFIHPGLAVNQSNCRGRTERQAFPAAGALSGRTRGVRTSSPEM